MYDHYQGGKPVDKEVEAKIPQQAVIYRRESKWPLSNYQKQINKAVGEIALRDPFILSGKRIIYSKLQKKMCT